MRRSRLIIAGSSVVVAAVGGLIFYHWAVQPVTVKPGTGVGMSPSEDSKSTSFKTSYYTATIPAAYTIRELKDTDEGAVLSSLMATKSSQESGQLAITVTSLPSGGINEVADIRLRRERTDVYQSSSLVGLPTDVAVFRSKQSNEVSLFWKHGSLCAALVLRDSNSSSDVIDSQLTDMFRTWRWQ